MEQYTFSGLPIDSDIQTHDYIIKYTKHVFQSFEFTKWKSLSPIRSKFSVSSLSLNNWCSGSPPFSVLSQYCDFPGGSDGTSVCLQCGRPGFDPLVRKIPWRRKWQSTLVLLPGKSHGWRSLVGCSPWVIKESDTTDQLHFLSFWVNIRITGTMED